MKLLDDSCQATLLRQKSTLSIAIVPTQVIDRFELRKVRPRIFCPVESGILS